MPSFHRISYKSVGIIVFASSCYNKQRKWKQNLLGGSCTTLSLPILQTDSASSFVYDTELAMGHFFKTQPNPKFLDPTQPTKVFTRPNPTHHRHLVWHIRLYRKLYTTTVLVTDLKISINSRGPIQLVDSTFLYTSQLSMKVIIHLQYSLTDSRVFHDVKNITQSSLHPTQPNQLTKN